MPDLAPADVGFAEEATADVSVDHLSRLANTLDVAPLVVGDPLPLLWHWAAFTPHIPTASLGPDGHPEVPAGLADYPRRVWGAGELTLERPLRAGVSAIRRTTVSSVREVSGRSGRLLIVKVEHRCSQSNQVCVVERQSIIYRAAGEPVPLPKGDFVPTPGHGWRRAVRAEETTMFRYCAVTFNSHRIHYDARYAIGVEGYPAAVFPGPLSAMLLARDAAADAGAPLTALSFRATAPLFAGSTFTMTGALSGTHGTALLYRNDGVIAMEASYEVLSA